MPQPVPIKPKSSLTLCPTESSSLWGMELITYVLKSS